MCLPVDQSAYRAILAVAYRPGYYVQVNAVNRRGVAGYLLIVGQMPTGQLANCLEHLCAEPRFPSAPAHLLESLDCPLAVGYESTLPVHHDQVLGALGQHPAHGGTPGFKVVLSVPKALLPAGLSDPCRLM